MTSQEHLYVRATTLAEAWNRFEPDLPLPHDSPFYVTRADNPRSELELALFLNPSDEHIKKFFAGH